jgi:AraC family chitin signaling transcriptional activator
MFKHQQIIFTRECKRCLTVIILFSLSLSSIAQSAGSVIGNPPVYHYTHQDFNSDAQFWSACQDSMGVMFFGNNYGILRFNGERWDKISLPNNSAVRSLHKASDGTIYAGGFNEFGTIVSNDDGSFSYHSLRSSLPPKYTEFGNVWQIMEIHNTVILRTFEFICLISNRNIEIIEASDAFRFAGISQNRLFVLDQNQLFLLDINSSRFHPVASEQALNNESILKIFPGKNKKSVFLLTQEGSLFDIRLDSDAVKKVQELPLSESKQVLTSAIQTSSGEIYIGTLSHNLSSWKFQNNKLASIRSFPELQDQTVLNLFESHENTIWVLLNKGLDYFDPKAHLTSIFQGSSIYDAIMFEGKLHIATNQGVFRSSKVNPDSILNQNEFEKLPSLGGQAWSLKVIGNQLFCAHDKGLYRIAKNKISKVPGFSGVWKLYPVSGSPQNYFICTYNGLGLLSVSQNKYTILQTSWLT